MAEMDEAESRRIRIDILKHLSTLNTGSILIAGAMLEKFPHGAVLPLACTFAALICSLATCVVLLIRPERILISGNRLLFLVACVLFIIGISFLSLFVFGGFELMIAQPQTTYIRPHN